jgi:hypothetical protein
MNDKAMTAPKRSILNERLPRGGPLPRFLLKISTSPITSTSSGFEALHPPEYRAPARS